MKKDFVKSFGGFFLAVFLMIFCVLGCNPEKPKPEPPPTTTRTPELKVQMTAFQIRKASDEIRNNILPNYLLKCSETEKEQWFTIYEENGVGQLFEFVHNYNFNSLEKAKFWKFVPEGILKSDFNDQVGYQGKVVFTLYDDKDDNKRNFLYKYDREKSQWGNSENFDREILTKYRLPLEIPVRKKKDAWQFKTPSGSWSSEFLFEKPKISCEVLKGKGSIKQYHLQLFGPPPTPTPDPEPVSGKAPCRKAYLNEGAKLRSAAEIDSENVLSIWHKGSELEILSVEEGSSGLRSSSTVWYKVKMLGDDCDETPFCKTEGFIHSSLVDCSTAP